MKLGESFYLQFSDDGREYVKSCTAIADTALEINREWPGKVGQDGFVELKCIQTRRARRWWKPWTWRSGLYEWEVTATYQSPVVA